MSCFVGNPEDRFCCDEAQTGKRCANKIVLEQTSPIVLFQLFIYLFPYDNFTLNSIFGP